MPETVAASLAPGQAAIAGLVLGEGTTYTLTAMDVMVWPGVQTDDTPSPDGYGEWFGPADRWAGRTAYMEVVVKAAAGETLRDTVRALVDACVTYRQHDTVNLEWYPPDDTPKLLRGRVRKLDVDDSTYAYGWVRVVLAIKGELAPVQAGGQSNGVTGLPLITGGRSYDRTYPLTYGTAGVDSGTISATNDGNVPAHWTARIDGPVANPYIELASAEDSNPRLSFAITLAAGEYLVIDSLSATVMLNGTASRQNAIVGGSRWFRLPPGTTDVRFNAQSYVDGAQLTLSWRAAQM